MSLFVVDVEADGPAAGPYSMVSFAAVIVEPGFGRFFRADVAPISDKFIPESLAVSGVTRERHLGFEPAAIVMPRFRQWVEQNNSGKATLVSDNPMFDGGVFLNYYLHVYAGGNPFGHSARRIGDFCAGLKGDWGASSAFKKLRVAKHTHDPLDDALGNAQALVELCRQHGVSLPGFSKAGPKPKS